MKKLITLLFVVIAVNATFAQGNFEKGSNAINVGIGFGSTLLTTAGYTSSPLLSASFEHGIWEIGGPGVISLGGYVGYKSYSYDYAYYGWSYSEDWNYTIIGVRGAYHWNGIKSDKFDLYGGLMVSMNLVSYSYTETGGSNPYYTPGTYSNALGSTLFIGGRYYFSKNIAVYSEAGWGVGMFNIGITFKF